MENVSLQSCYSPPAFQRPMLEYREASGGAAPFQAASSGASAQTLYSSAAADQAADSVAALAQTVAQLVSLVAGLLERILGGTSGDASAASAGSAVAASSPLEDLGRVLDSGKDLVSEIKQGFTSLWGG